jgi:hypothetical protein
VHDSHFVVIDHDSVKEGDQVQILIPAKNVFLYVAHHLLIIWLQQSVGGYAVVLLLSIRKIN